MKKRIFWYGAGLAAIVLIQAVLNSVFYLESVRNREDRALEAAFCSIPMDSQRSWVDSRLGPPEFIHDHGDLLECIYRSDGYAARVFYHAETDACSACLVTVLEHHRGVCPDVDGADGRRLGEFTYYDIPGAPQKVMGYVTNGIARSFYLEAYSGGAGDPYTYYFSSADYGTDWKEECFASRLVLTRDEPYIDREIGRACRDGSMVTLSHREQVRPNTFGKAKQNHAERVMELLMEERWELPAENKN